MSVQKIDKGIHIGSGATWITVLSGEIIQPTSVNYEPEQEEEIEVETEKEPIKYVPWGDSNDFPKKQLDAIKQVTVVGSGIRKRAKIHFGRGVYAYEKAIDEQGFETTKPTVNPEVLEFFKLNRIPQLAKKWITDYEMFGIYFPEFILDAGSRNKIVKTRHLHALFCRKSVFEDMDGFFRSKFVLYSPKFPDEAEKENTAAIHCIHPEMEIEEIKTYLQENQIDKFVRPVMLYTPGHDYYPIPFWHAAIESKWVEIAKLIPLVKKAIIQNSMTLKYIVKIPMDYFKKKYPENDFTAEQREQKIEEDLQALDDYLKNYENTGSNLTTYYDIDHRGQKSGAWEIEVLDNKIKEGALNLDSAAANSEILFSIGIDPTLIGAGMPGKELGAKSGSDKREAFNIAISDAMYDRIDTLDTLQFIAEFNDWENVHFAYKDNILTTLDKNPTGVQKDNI